MRWDEASAPMLSLINWIWKFVRRFLFRFDPEGVHRFSMRVIKALPLPAQNNHNDSAQVFGMPFLSRVGLAAGFDKNAEILTKLPKFGFGFAEIGSVTEKPQPGNPKPRLFRDLSQHSLLNRMGFNNLGATLIAARLEKAREKLPPSFRIGVNIGINKDTLPDGVIQNYLRAIRPFEGLADYFVINVSSPNTPGLRALQESEKLKPILCAVLSLVHAWRQSPPVLIKLGPDLERENQDLIIRNAESWGVGGFVLTNSLPQEGGGVSGKPLTSRSREVLRQVRALTALPVISVGGICSLEEALVRRQMGADLVQIYTGWIFKGPAFPFELGKHLK